MSLTQKKLMLFSLAAVVFLTAYVSAVDIKGHYEVIKNQLADFSKVAKTMGASPASHEAIALRDKIADLNLKIGNSLSPTEKLKVASPVLLEISQSCTRIGSVNISALESNLYSKVNKSVLECNTAIQKLAEDDLTMAGQIVSLQNSINSGLLSAADVAIAQDKILVLQRELTLNAFKRDNTIELRTKLLLLKNKAQGYLENLKIALGKIRNKSSVFQNLSDLAAMGNLSAGFSAQLANVTDIAVMIAQTSQELTIIGDELDILLAEIKRITENL